MSFQPVIPMLGLAGWAFLNRTQERQQEAFNASPRIARDSEYLKTKITETTTAEALVNDRRLLRITLGAFGLQDDLENRAFIRQVIEDGVDDQRALANRLADKRYFALASAMVHLARDGDQTAPADLADRLVTQYRNRTFEVAVGEQDQDMRLSVALQRELPRLLGDYKTEAAQWFGLLGTPPLRAVVEAALGLPKEFGALDIEDQVARLKAGLSRHFNVTTLAELSAPDKLEQLTKRFLVMSQLRESQSMMNGASIALVLLTAGRD